MHVYITLYILFTVCT